MGVTRHDGQWALTNFARQNNSRIYYSHGADDVNLFKSALPASDEVLESNLQFLMNRSSNINFNLNGVVNSVDNIPQVVQWGRQGSGARIVMDNGIDIGNHTNWEAMQILTNKSLYDKTTFFLNGEKVKVLFQQ